MTTREEGDVYIESETYRNSMKFGVVTVVSMPEGPAPPEKRAFIA